MVIGLSLKINQECQHTSAVYIHLMLKGLQHQHSEGQHIVRLVSFILLKMMRDNLYKYVI